MIDEETLVKWEAWSKRDDAWKLFVPSDLRQMLGEIRRLQVVLDNVWDKCLGTAEAIRLARESQWGKP